MKIKGIIFDFDGTLFDSMWIWKDAGIHYLQSVHVDAEPSLSEKLKEMSLRQSAVYLKENYHLSLSIREIEDGVNRIVEEAYLSQVLPKPQVIPLLKKLQTKGIRMCIATATDLYQIKAALKRCDMEGYFEKIYTCSEVGSGKDQPDIFECALQGLGLKKEETAVIEDAFHAAKTAKEAGFYVIGVYDPYEDKAKDLRRISDVYVDSFSEMESLFGI